MKENEDAKKLIKELETLREQVKTKDLLLQAFHKINQAILSPLNQGELLDTFAQQVVEAGVFRSLAISLVDRESHCVEVVQNYVRSPQGVRRVSEVVGIKHDLDSKDISAETVRTGQLQIAVEWDERFDGRLPPEAHKGQVAYFIPVKRSGQVVVVLATGSTIAEKGETLERIEAIRPLLDQVAVGLENNRLYSNVRKELFERKQVEGLLVEKERFLTFYAQMSQAILSSLDLDEILDNLAKQLIDAGVFRSLMIALVNESGQYVEVVRALTRVGSDGNLHAPYVNQSMLGRRHHVRDDDATAEVARTGEMRVFEHWEQDDEKKAAYFFPVKHGDRVLAVLGTGSSCEDKEEMIHRIEMMQPLLDQVAVSLACAGLFLEVQQGIAERQEVEDALEESEQLHRRAIETTGAVPYQRDFKNNTYRFVGEGIEYLIGYTPEEFTVDVWSTIVLDGTPIGNMKSLRLRQAEEINDQMDTWQAEYKVRTRSGEIKWLADASAAIRNEEGQLVTTLGILRDITPQKQVEEEMVRVQRLRAGAELSAGISHNLNNILMGILGPAQLLQGMTGDPDMRQNIDDIIASASRATDLVHRLHTSTHRVVEDTFEPILIPAIVKEAIHNARPRWKDEAEANGVIVEVIERLEDGLFVRANVSEFNDMMVNLLFNAVDAMPEGGTITVETKAVDDQIVLIVADTGEGMDEEVKARIFEPFFTTKAEVGTGLGLSTVYHSVNKWGGQILVESKLGVGTTFQIQFPISEAGDLGVEETVSERQVRRAKIVIVEDDPIVCKFLGRFLAQHHEVKVFEAGPQALNTFELGQYDVALIDLGLPEMRGDELARKMCQIDPCLVTVLISGWELAADDSRRMVFDFHMRKPFNNLDLALDIIDRAMDLHTARKRNG